MLSKNCAWHRAAPRSVSCRAGDKCVKEKTAHLVTWATCDVLPAIGRGGKLLFFLARLTGGDYCTPNVQGRARPVPSVCDGSRRTTALGGDGLDWSGLSVSLFLRRCVSGRRWFVG